MITITPVIDKCIIYWKNHEPTKINGYPYFSERAEIGKDAMANQYYYKNRKKLIINDGYLCLLKNNVYEDEYDFECVYMLDKQLFKVDDNIDEFERFLGELKEYHKDPIRYILIHPNPMMKFEYKNVEYSYGSCKFELKDIKTFDEIKYKDVFETLGCKMAQFRGMIYTSYCNRMGMESLSNPMSIDDFKCFLDQVNLLNDLGIEGYYKFKQTKQKNGYFII